MKLSKLLLIASLALLCSGGTFTCKTESNSSDFTVISK